MRRRQKVNWNGEIIQMLLVHGALTAGLFGNYWIGRSSQATIVTTLITERSFPSFGYNGKGSSEI